MIPEINKTYNCFDDGKISTSRLYTVTVKEIIPFDEIDEKTLYYWKEEAKQCHWLYKPETDYFIKTINEDDEIEFFVRIKKYNDGWFSIGGFLKGGLLDIDGEFMKILQENERANRRY